MSLKPLQEHLSEIRERAKRASKGPWKEFKTEHFHSVEAKELTGCDSEDETYSTVCNMPVENYDYGCAWGTAGNAEFIAHARTDIPKLLKALELAIEQRDYGFAKWASAKGDPRLNGPICDECDLKILAILTEKNEGL